MSASRLIPKFTPSNIATIKDTNRALREIKKVDPKTRYVLLFPDSSRVHVGLGFNLLGTPAEKVYEDASSILKKDLLRLCLEGPKSELRDSLENRHLATFVTSHAAMAKLQDEKPDVVQNCKAAGGCGVGFLNCLVFGGAMSFENGLDLVQRQARAMEAAAKIVPCVKLFVKAKPAARKIRICDAAREHCIKLGVPKEIAVCSISKFIHEQKFEIIGHEEAIKYIEAEGERLLNISYCKRIPAIDDYNSELMTPAKEFLEGYIKQRLKADSEYLKEPLSCSAFSGTSAHRPRGVDAIIKDICNYPVKPSRIEGLLTCLFKRPKELAQPNILVLWDRSLHRCLELTNRRAFESSKLLPV